MKKRLKLKKTSLFALLLVTLMSISCVFSVMLDSLKASGNRALAAKGFTLRDADVEYDYENNLKTEAIRTSQKFNEDDKVLVIIEVDDNSLINNYSTYASSKYESLSDYVSSDYAHGYAMNMQARQETLFNRLNSQYEMEYKFSYTSFFNAFSAYVRYGDIKSIEADSKVSNVIISEKYDVPQYYDANPTANFAENIVKIDEKTGIYDTDSLDIDYTGLGTIVAVLDTGLDHQHPAFQNKSVNGKPKDINGDGKYYETDIAQKLASENFAASALSVGLSSRDVYVNEKVPYAYDYANKDPEVFPTNMHGTHVAGIIAGHDEVIRGSAPGAQLAIMKVFPDKEGGAEEADLWAALEDCVKLDVDVINMSLGSGGGFARDKDIKRTNEVYQMIYDAGINLVVAVGNDYSSGFGSTYGLNLASNPDSGTAGSPSTYSAGISVASISGVKTPYLFAYDGTKDKNGQPVNGLSVYYTNPSDNNGEELEFMERLLVDNSGNEIQEKEFEYVVIPGIGTSADYSGLNVEGKIVVVKRGIDTFITKIDVAAAFGAVGIIVRNHVSGIIRMSLGVRELIPACSIKMDVGNELNDRANASSAAGRGRGGKIILGRSYKAGPFMSDFSAWGPTPDLDLKPEITAHGGDITSADIGGGYDTISGTSMAAPNFSGIVSLLRQHVISNAEDYGLQSTDTNSIRTLVNQLFMSTATIAINENSDPYSPRKQGAGLADLEKSLNTRAYLYVKNNEGSVSDKTKICLGDDKDKTGTYVLDFYLKNLSNRSLTYNLGTVVMTEGLSSDKKSVTEIPVLLNDASKDVKVSTGGSYSKSNKTVTVNANSDAHIEITIKLTKANKKYLNETFANGMYVEGFAKLTPTVSGASAVALNIPYLAFYGDWTDAPILDKTVYEVSPDEVNDSLLEHEKNKADVKPVTPFGRAIKEQGNNTYEYYFPLGAQLYLSADQFEDTPTESDKSALSLNDEGIFMLWGVGGFLRNSKTINIKISNAYTGQVMVKKPYQNGKKASVVSSGLIQFDDELDIRKFISETGVKFLEGNKYTFEMECFLDWGDGKTYGNKNKFSFDFYIDSAAPEIVDVGVRLEKDKNFNNEKRYVDFEIFDSHYASVMDLQYYNKDLQKYTSVFTGGVKPLHAQRGGLTRATIDVSDYWDQIVDNDYEMMVMVCDYGWNMTYQYLNIKESYNAINSLKFDDRYLSSSLHLSSLEEYDLRRLLTVTGEQSDRLPWDEDYIWESDNEDVVSVHEGKVVTLSAGAANVEVSSLTNPEVRASINISVSSETFNNREKVYPNKLVMSNNTLNLPTGVNYNISAELLPHTITDEYRIVWTSNYAYIDSVYKDVDESGKNGYDRAGEGWVDVVADPLDSSKAVIQVRGAFREEVLLGRGPVITARVETRSNPQSEWVDAKIVASCFISIPQTYVVTFHKLDKYNGCDPIINIPGDLGIEIIGKAALLGNSFMTEVTVPEGVKAIEASAFAYCSSLKTVNLPASLISIADWAFAARNPKYGIEGAPAVTSLETVNIAKYPDGTRRLRTIGERAFTMCEKLTTIDLSTVASIGEVAFLFCSSLKKIDLSSAKTIGMAAFYENTALEEVIFSEGVDIGEAAFQGNYSLSEVELPASRIGEAAFYFCTNLNESTNEIYGGLERVRFVGDGPITIGNLAFANSMRILELDFGDTIITSIGSYAFAGCHGLFNITLPKGLEKIEGNAFQLCGSLQSVHIPADTKLEQLTTGGLFGDCANFKTITVDPANPYLTANNNIVTTKNGGTIVMVAPSADVSAMSFDGVKSIAPYAFANNTSLVSIDLKNVESIGNGAFSGCTNLTTVKVNGATISIGAYAFENCSKLNNVDFSNATGLETIGDGAFRGCTALKTINLPSKIDRIANNTFYNCTGLTSVTFESEITSIGEYAFINSSITTIDLSKVTSIGKGAFMLCTKLKDIDLSKVVTIGDYAFQKCDVLNVTNLPLVTDIGAYAFAQCRAITSLSMPEVRNIGVYAFSVAFVNPIYNADSKVSPTNIPNSVDTTRAKLASVTLGKIHSIGANAFSYTLLETIDLPATLQYIGANAFANCSKLTRINVNDSNPYVFDDNGVLYSRLPKQVPIFGTNNTMDDYSENSLQLIAYPAARTATEVTKINSDGLPVTYTFYKVLTGTTRIEAGAFIGSTLEYIELPYELMIIGHEAFFKCNALRRIDFQSYYAPTLEALVTFEDAIIWSQIPEAYDYYAFDKSTANYSNFVFSLNSISYSKDIEIFCPANGMNYTSYLYNEFFVSATKTFTYAMSPVTESFISAIWALPELNDMNWERDKPIVDVLENDYSLMTADQKAFINQATLDRLNAAIAWAPAVGKTGCCKGGCGTIALFGGDIGGMIIGGGLMMLIATALFFAFRRKNKIVEAL